MTVANTTAWAGPYAGNGVTTAFPFSFEAAAADEVGVNLDGVAQVAGFTVSLEAGGNGGTVTFAVAPATGVEVIPFANPDFAQDIDFTNSGPFLPATHTEGFDRSALKAIWLKDQVERSFRVPYGKSGLLLGAEAGVLGVDDDGDAVFHPTGSFVGATGPAGDVAMVETRDALAGVLAPAAFKTRWLAEDLREGIFQWKVGDYSALVAADTERGIYVPSNHVAATIGCWVRRFFGFVNPEWWGAVPDDIGYLGTASATDSYPAFAAMFATLMARCLQVNDSDAFCEAVWLNGYYYSSQYWDLKGAVKVFGAGTKYNVRARVRFPLNSHGFIVNYITTTGDTTEAATTEAAGTMFDGVHALGGGGTTGHAWFARARMSLRNGGARNFGEDGFHAHTAAGDIGARQGNSNCSDVLDNQFFGNGGWAIFIAGGDSSATRTAGNDCSFNGRGGICGASFLGTKHEGEHTAWNGNHNYVTNAGVPRGTEVENGTQGVPRCSHGGNIYVVAPGKEAIASTTTPGTDATIWILLVAGGVATETPAWFSGINVRWGAPYAAVEWDDALGVINPTAPNNRTDIHGYVESGQPPCWNGGVGLFDGFMEAVFRLGPGRYVKAGGAGRTVFSTGLETDSGDLVMTDGAIKLSGISAAIPFGASGGIGTQISGGLVFGGKTGSVNDNTWFNGLGQNILSNPTGTLDLDANGNLSVAAGKGFKVNGTQVVGARGAAVADAAAPTSVDGTNAAAAPTQAEFNALVAEFNKLRADVAAVRSAINTSLARDRAHGLIAP